MRNSERFDQVTVITACAAQLGEGPVWVAREEALYWVDIEAPAVWRWRNGEVSEWTPPYRISALAPRRSRGFVAATEHGFALVDPEHGVYEPTLNPEAHIPGNRFNDGKLAPDGSFWAGTMDDAEQDATGALYRLAHGKCTRIDRGYRIPNGPAFSPDGRAFYHSDSALRTVYRFQLAGDAVGAREIFLRFDEGDGYPDGMTTDSAGCLWIAFWDGHCVRRFSPGGEPLERIDLPVRRPTSCTFGGSGLDRLFVTSARIGLSTDQIAAQPLAGALFAVNLGVCGVPQPLFAS
jgi:xylono-1,5-lactonase